MSKHSTPVVDAIKALDADPANFIIERKKGANKKYKGSEFLRSLFSTEGFPRQESWFTINDSIEITRSMAKPGDSEDYRAEFEGTRLIIQTTVSKAGQFGQFLMKLQPIYEAAINKMAADGQIDISKRSVHQLVQTHYGDNHPSMAGEPIDDPVIRLQIKFDNFPAKYPITWLQNKPKTTLWDHSKVTPAGKYELLTPPSGDALSADNVHQVILAGAVIKRMRVMASSVILSSSWVSMPFIIHEAIIQPAGDSGFEDDLTSAPHSSDDLGADPGAIIVQAAPSRQPEASNDQLAQPNADIMNALGDI
jgi:hypothetical protein